jgi:hypothetical protein
MNFVISTTIGTLFFLAYLYAGDFLAGLGWRLTFAKLGKIATQKKLPQDWQESYIRNSTFLFGSIWGLGWLGVFFASQATVHYVLRLLGR